YQTIFNGEFDPGSGRTLAACLIHASRMTGVRYQRPEVRVNDLSRK
ncbi:hypothetical protein EDD72_1353, partial [Tepidibacillus fermentans]